MTHSPTSQSLRFASFGTALRAVALGLLVTAAPLVLGTTITVTASTKIRTVDERVFGMNTNIWDQAGSTAETVALIKAADLRFLRYPGGSLSDEYHWKTNKSLNNAWTWANGPDAFISVAKQVGCQVVITANYGTGTPAEAAEWVTYCNVTKTAGFKYWEIGNENYGTWETDAQARAHDPYVYANRAKDYIAQMKAADPTIKVGVVVVAGEDEYATYSDHPATNPRTAAAHNGWTPVMLATLKSLGVTPDFVAYHRYDGAPGSETDAALLQAAQTWATDIGRIRQQLTDYLGAAGANVEILVTENNSVYAGPGKQTTGLVNALYLADSYGQILQTEVNGLNWWGLRNGRDLHNNNSATLYGWRQYGDYGILSTPAALEDNEVLTLATGAATAYQCYPTYYALKLLSKFARGGDSIVKVTSDNSLLTAFGCLRTDGTLRLLVINKSPSAILSSTIAISGFTPAASATTYTFGMVEDNNAKNNNGTTDLTTGSLANAAASFSTSFEPYSLTVLSFAAGTTNGGGSTGGGSTGGGSSSGGGGGGGGGSPSLWYLVALAGIGLARRLARRRG